MVTRGEPAPLPISNVNVLGVAEPDGQSEIMSGHRHAPLTWLTHELGLLAFVEPVVVTPWLDTDNERVYQVISEDQSLHDPESKLRLGASHARAVEDREPPGHAALRAATLARYAAVRSSCRGARKRQPRSCSSGHPVPGTSIPSFLWTGAGRTRASQGLGP